MDQAEFNRRFSNVGLKGIKYYATVGSTNDEALVWATQDAKDMSLVFAEHQTKGKGRNSREWHSAAEHSLTFSVILKPGLDGQEVINQCPFLAALALVNTLRGMGIEARVKWPNDVLIRGRKVAGILVENVWTGAIIDSVIIGIGVNLDEAAFGDHQTDLRYPATSVAANHEGAIDRYEFLDTLLKEISALRKVLGSGELLEMVNAELAFVGQDVWMNINNAPAEKVVPLRVGEDGRLIVRNAAGEEIPISVGEIERE